MNLRLMLARLLFTSHKEQERPVFFGGRTRVAIFRAYYPRKAPDTAFVRYRALSQKLTDLGAEVEIITTTFDHGTRSVEPEGVYREYDGRVKVHAFYCGSYSKNISFQRVFFEFRFALKSVFFLIRNSRPDLVVVGEPAFFVGTLLGIFGKVRRVTVVGDFVDLWPEAYVAAREPGFLVRVVFSVLAWSRAFRLKRLFSKSYFCSLTYRQALSRPSNTGSLVDAGVYYWCSGLQLGSFGDRARERVGVLYLGSLGEGYDIEGLLKTAAELKRLERRVVVYVAGDGPKREICVAAARAGVIVYLGFISGGQVKELLQTVSIGLLPYRSSSAVAMPIKMFDYLRAGLLIVSSIQLEAKEVLARYKCGITYDPEGGSAAMLSALVSAIDRVEARAVDVAGQPDDFSRFAATLFNPDDEYRRFAADVLSNVRVPTTPPPR